jgi:hypothetical protein
MYRLDPSHDSISCLPRVGGGFWEAIGFDSPKLALLPDAITSPSTNSSGEFLGGGTSIKRRPCPATKMKMQQCSNFGEIPIPMFDHHFSPKLREKFSGKMEDNLTATYGPPCRQLDKHPTTPTTRNSRHKGVFGILMIFPKFMGNFENIHKKKKYTR